ncbi:MAG: hypothetical protein HRU09_07020 [Oligoflexales bacterium]|nr:hypothetical protein [Oligoflexales bacterium]
MKQWNLPWKVYLASFLLTACSTMCSKSHEEMSAEEVVEAYLDFALNITDVSEKEELMEFTTGNLEAALAGATDETFMTAYVERKYKITRFSLLERRDRTPRETEITFQLTYRDIPEGSNDIKDAPEVTTENTVAVIKEKGKWLVREVVGNKTTFDFPTSELSKITAKPGQISDPSLDQVKEPDPVVDEQ